MFGFLTSGSHPRATTPAARSGRDSEFKREQCSPSIRWLKTFGNRRERCPPRSREHAAENGRCGSRARAQHVGQPVPLRSRGRCSQQVEEIFPNGEIEPDQQCGLDGRRAVCLFLACGSGTLHPIKKAPLDILPNEGVQPELAVEVVVDRTGGDVRRRRQLADGDLIEQT